MSERKPLLVGKYPKPVGGDTVGLYEAELEEKLRAAEREAGELRERNETLTEQRRFSDEAVRILRKALGWVEAECSTTRNTTNAPIYGRVSRALEELNELERRARAAPPTGEDQT